MAPLDDSLVNRAAPPGSLRYFSLLYAPADKRDQLCALYVIDAELRESAQSANHDVAHTRLGWWRAEIDRLVNGGPQHPATRLLNEGAVIDRASFAKLHELVAAADMDLARMTYSNMQELRAYCSRSGGAIQELAAQLLAPAPLDEANRATANRIGVGVRQSEILRDLRQDAYGGHVYLPQDLLTRHTVTLDDLRGRDVPSRLKTALREFRDEVQQELRSALAAVNAPLRPLAVLAALHRRLLDRIASHGFDVATSRIDLGPIEKPWVAWRTARKHAS